MTPQAVPFEGFLILRRRNKDFSTGRQQINGSAAWWATMEATSKAIVGIAWEGGGVDDGYRGSKIVALIPDDRTPEGAL
ncbi:hypothetical protein GW17_00023718 [Ensete ventricosum]|nr:hypothetical protein GW17_00023718 [Ensete ventricosum]